MKKSKLPERIGFAIGMAIVWVFSIVVLALVAFLFGIAARVIVHTWSLGWEFGGWF